MLDRLFRNPRTGELAIAQLPNLPLWIFIAASAVRIVADPAGVAGTVVSVVGAVALIWWAIAEIGWGDSLFRRILGAAVLAGMVVSRLPR